MKKIYKLNPILVAVSPVILATALSMLGYFLSPELRCFYLSVAQKFSALMGPERELALMLLLLALNVSILICVFLSRKKVRYYEFDKEFGIYFHKTTRQPFCTSCLILNIESPLKEDEFGWRCQRNECDKFYPRHKAEPTKPVPSGAWT